MTDTTAKTAADSLETALRLYAEQVANYQAWLAGEDAEAAIDSITEDRNQ